MKARHEIVIIDSFIVSCEGVKHALGRRCFRISRSFRSTDSAIKDPAQDKQCAAILINHNGRPLPSMDTVELLRSTFGGARVIVIGETDESPRVIAALEAGFDGFLLESMDPEAFSKAVELIVLGERLFPILDFRNARQKLQPAPELAACSLGKLSASEMRVFGLLAKAFSNKAIARELGISEATVKVHVKAILRKMGARNRTEVALLSRDAAFESRIDGIAT